MPNPAVDDRQVRLRADLHRRFG